MARIRLMASAAVAATALALASPLSAQAAVPQYGSCAAVHAHWSGGIAQKGVRVNTVHHRNGSVSRVPLKGSVDYSTAAYEANRRLDRDRDGVACEKS